MLGILYESTIHPITILSTLPSAGVGALLALLLFKTEFSMTVAEGEARYEREVLRPTGSGRLGVTERGGGVASDVDITVTGSAAGQTWSYEAILHDRRPAQWRLTVPPPS